MKTGIELIAAERKRQILKGYTIENDLQINKDKQLLDATVLLMSYANHLSHSDYDFRECVPNGWNLDIWIQLCRKPYLERLTIAGAMIAAEIDRNLNLDKEERK